MGWQASSRNPSHTGSLTLRTPDGREFSCGSGLTARDRSNPPAVGTPSSSPSPPPAKRNESFGTGRLMLTAPPPPPPPPSLSANIFLFFSLSLSLSLSPSTGGGGGNVSVHGAYGQRLPALPRLCGAAARLGLGRLLRRLPGAAKGLLRQRPSSAPALHPVSAPPQRCSSKEGAQCGNHLALACCRRVSLVRFFSSFSFVGIASCSASGTRPPSWSAPCPTAPRASAPRWLCPRACHQPVRPARGQGQGPGPARPRAREGPRCFPS